MTGERSIQAVIRRALALCVLVALAVALVPAASAARATSRPGTLDPSFGRHGVFFSPPTPSFGENEFTGLTRLADGRLLVEGQRESAGSLSRVGVLTRRLPNGSIDPTFGKHGYVEGSSPDFSGVEGPEPSGLEAPVFEGIAVDSAGRILIGISGGKCRSHRVQRLLPDGSVDPSFGGPCGAKVPLPTHQIAVAGDGDILVGGAAQLAWTKGAPPPSTTGVVRLDPDGQLDTAYGEDGVAAISLPGDGIGSSGGTGAFAVLPDGGVALTTRDYVVRFTPEGKLDTSFGAGGKASIEAGTTVIAALPDGRLVVAGQEVSKKCCPQAAGPFLFTRLLQNGSPDPAFGEGGTTRLALGAADAPAAIAAVPGEGLLVAGTAGYGDCAHVVCDHTSVLVRLGGDGRPDPAFGSGGVVQIPLPLGESVNRTPSIAALVTGPGGESFLAAGIEDGSSYLVERDASGAAAGGFGGGRPIAWSPTVPSNMEPNSVGVLGNGRIVLSVFGDALRRGVTRFLMTLPGDGRPARSAAGASGSVASPELAKSIYASGKAIYFFAGGTKESRVMRVLPPGGAVPTAGGARLPKGFSGAGMTADGRGGVFAFGTVLGHPGLAVAHIRPDGHLDRSFGHRGTTVVRFGKGAGANALAVDGEGRAVVVGWAAGRAVATRLLPDGRLDHNFGRGGRVNLLGTDTNVTTVAVVGDEIVAGCRQETATGTSGSILVRLDGRGRRVRGFGRDGVVVAGGVHKPIAVLPSHGQAVLVTALGHEGGVRLRAYAGDGRPARGWGDGGETTARVGQRKIFIPIGATVTPGGQIVVAGTAGAWWVGNQTEVLRFR